MYTLAQRTQVFLAIDKLLVLGVDFSVSTSEEEGIILYRNTPEGSLYMLAIDDEGEVMLSASARSGKGNNRIFKDAVDDHLITLFCANS